MLACSQQHAPVLLSHIGATLTERKKRHRPREFRVELKGLVCLVDGDLELQRHVLGGGLDLALNVEAGVAEFAGAGRVEYRIGVGVCVEEVPVRKVLGALAVSGCRGWPLGGQLRVPLGVLVDDRLAQGALSDARDTLDPGARATERYVRS